MMIIKILMTAFLVFTSSCVFAGKVTIEKGNSLIRNDLFDAKRERAEEYKRREKERDRNNSEWSESLDPSCGLWRNTYLIYMCGNGRYYKGYETNEQIEYRELSSREIQALRSENSPSKNRQK